MAVLIIDSSSTRFSCAICQDGAIVSQILAERARKQLQFLSEFMQQVIRIAEISKDEIEYVATISGPGSFTGLRLALTTAKTAAQILGVRVVPVKSMDAVVASIPPASGITAAAIAAGRNEIFSAFYTEDLNRISDYLVTSPEQFVQLCKEKENLRITGTACEKYGELIREALPSVPLLERNFQYPTPYGIFKIADREWKRGNSVSWDQVSAEYMKKSEAEESREKKLANG